MAARPTGVIVGSPTSDVWSGRTPVSFGGGGGTLRTPGPAAPLVERAGRELRSTRPSEIAPRVLVADCNLLTAEAIALALEQMRFVARFIVPVTPGHLRDVAGWRPDLALLDVDSIDRTTCLQCVAVLREEQVPVAIMADGSDLTILGECVDAGAAWVVDKSSPIARLTVDIARLLAGEEVLDETSRDRLTDSARREERARRARLAPFDVLTRREQQVLAELMEGHGADAIARRSTVSTSTVRSQIKAVLQKLGVNSQLAAAAMASQAGWRLDPDDRQDPLVLDSAR
jgi:two-component system, NarL family, nitrate/nitrite response regulator NarL